MLWAANTNILVPEKIYSMLECNSLEAGNCSSQLCPQNLQQCLTKFFLTLHIHLTSSQLLSLQASLQLFAGKMLSKCLLNPEAWIFYTTGVNKLISRWIKCVDYNGSYFV